MAGPSSTDAASFTALYRRYAPAVHRRARSLLNDEAEAWDVTQEVFIGFFKGGSRLRGEASPFTVLYQMATYQAIDRLRARSRWSGSLHSLSIDEDSDGPALQVTHPRDDAARINAAKDLALLTAGEDEQTLTAALLYFVEGYTTEELAQTLSVSRKTVGRMLAAFCERAQKRAERFGMENRP